MIHSQRTIRLYSLKSRSGHLYPNPLRCLPFPAQSLIREPSPLDNPFLKPLLIQYPLSFFFERVHCSIMYVWRYFPRHHLCSGPILGKCDCPWQKTRTLIPQALSFCCYLKKPSVSLISYDQFPVIQQMGSQFCTLLSELPGGITLQRTGECSISQTNVILSSSTRHARSLYILPR